MQLLVGHGLPKLLRHRKGGPMLGGLHQTLLGFGFCWHLDRPGRVSVRFQHGIDARLVILA